MTASRVLAACHRPARGAASELVGARPPYRGLAIALLPLTTLAMGACGKVQADPQAGAPPAAQVVSFSDVALFTVEHPEQFPLATATAHPSASEMIVTGTVTPDLTRNVPVVSLASGRVVAIKTKLARAFKRVSY
jgi:cobalt-zinc-cadmium efflux system membrane fusion protein